MTDRTWKMENCSGILADVSNYELTFILSGDLTEAKQKSLLEKLTKIVDKEGGKIAKEDKWGKKVLAYPIKKKKEGLYFLWQLELPSEKAGSVNRSFELSEEVLRNLLVRSADYGQQSTAEKKKTVVGRL